MAPSVVDTGAAQIRAYLEAASKSGRTASEFWEDFDRATRLYDAPGQSSEQYVAAQRAFAAASWGLLATMPESMPFVLRSLRSPSKSSRETGLGILVLVPQCGVDVIPTVHELLGAADASREQQGAALDVLAKLRDARSTAVVAAMVLDPALDPELSFDAARAFLKIIGKRLPRGADPIALARSVARAPR